MAPNKSDDTQTLKQALIRLLDAVREPAREEAEKVVGKKALSILGLDKKPDAKPNKQTDVSVSEQAKKNQQQETVRQAFREAETADQISAAIQQARELGMNFEVSLGERKLSKLATSVSGNETVSSRE
jgi:hypothetical protein